MEHSGFLYLSESGSRFGKFRGDARFYETIPMRVPITLGLRGGYVQAYGKAPFYYLSRLGQRDNLRGFLRNRFSGSKALFLNSDLRFDFGTVENIIVPFGVGFFGFWDAGKILAAGEGSDKWHLGYGGGFYLSPVNDNFNLSFSAATSEEEDLLFEFSFGFTL